MLNQNKMENGEQGAFACASDGGYQQGLTKREYFAVIAMQGCLANIVQGYGLPNVAKESIERALKEQQEFIDNVAIKAVRYSEALLKALETQ